MIEPINLLCNQALRLFQGHTSIDLFFCENPDLFFCHSSVFSGRLVGHRGILLFFCQIITFHDIIFFKVQNYEQNSISPKKVVSSAFFRIFASANSEVPFLQFACN